MSNRIKKALISVTDKTGIVEFAKELKKFDVEILSTGGNCCTVEKGRNRGHRRLGLHGIPGNDGRQA